MDLADKLTLNRLWDNFNIICRTQTGNFVVNIETHLEGLLIGD